MNKKLIYLKQPPLTPAEGVCCATYMSHLEGLNTLSGSTRLEKLLADDLEEITSKNKKGKKA